MNGLSFCLATNTEPFKGSSSSGVSISTDPIFDASGQVESARLSKPTSAGEHAFRPSADDGFTVIPSGSVTTALSRCADASPSGFSFCGMRTSTSRPVGESAWLEVGWTLIDGSNGRSSQPVMAGPV